MAPQRFLCTLKTFLHELKIWGPEGDPDAEKAVQKVTLLPYPLPDSVACASANVSQVDRDDGNRSYHFMDRGSAINASVLDVFDGGDDVGTRSATPATDLETGRTTQSRTIHVPETTVAAETTRRTRPSQLAGEDIELRPRNVL